MQNEKTIDRLNNPPVIENKKPIDLGDMPENMHLALTKAAIFEIVEKALNRFLVLKTKEITNISECIFEGMSNEGFVAEPTTADEYNEKWLKDIKKDK